MKLNWKKLAIACGLLTALIIARAVVTIGRAQYWGGDWLGPIQEDPWIYIGFLAAALGIIAWTKIPGKEPAEPTEEENQEAL